MTPEIRFAVPDDAQAILRIYAPYVLNTPVTFETKVPTIEQYRGRIEFILQRFPFLVAQDEDGVVMGYSYAGTFKGREAYDWSVETTIYLAEEAKGSGLAQRLYGALEQLLVRQNITNANACIAYPNEASVRFHEKQGFRTVAHFTECGYKLGSWRDMIWMEKHISPHENPPEEMISITLLRDKSFSV